jgi:hypothetical protein
MLGYRRVRQCQEMLYRLFKLKPYVMERWSSFAEQLLDIIENGRERWPGIARNGVVNKYVENVLQTLFAQLHTHGLTAVTADAALASLRLDLTSPVFIRYQMDAEMAVRSGGHGGAAKRELEERTFAPAAPEKKKSRAEKAFCFSHFRAERVARVKPNAAFRMPSRHLMVINRSFERMFGLARVRSARTHSDTVGDHGLTQWR